MAPRRGHADRPLGRLLAADVGKVEVVGGVAVEPLRDSWGRRRDVDVAGKESDRLRKRRNGDHLDVLHHGRLHGAGGRHHDALQRPLAVDLLPPLAGGRDRDRQGPAGRPRCALKRELAHDGVVKQAVRRKLTASGEDAERDRQVERGSLFGQFGWGEIDHDPLVRPVKTRVDHRPGYPVRALADGGIRHTHEHCGWKGAAGDIDFDVDRNRLDPEQ